LLTTRVDRVGPMPRIVSRRFVLAAACLALSACGAAATVATPPERPAAPTYAQVIAAMSGAQSVDLTADFDAGVTVAIQSDATGLLLGKTTRTGVGSFQFYVRPADLDGTTVKPTFDAIPDAGFAASCSSCHVKPNVCIAFSAAMEQATGLSAAGITGAYTPKGFTALISKGAPTMTVQTSTVVDDQPVYVFKGSGFELDVPFGSKLPVRVVSTGKYTASFTEWNSVASIAKPASCP
jgi:hypothetical protein